MREQSPTWMHKDLNFTWSLFKWSKFKCHYLNLSFYGIILFSSNYCYFKHLKTMHEAFFKNCFLSYIKAMMVWDSMDYSPRFCWPYTQTYRFYSYNCCLTIIAMTTYPVFVDHTRRRIVFTVTVVAWPSSPWLPTPFLLTIHADVSFLQLQLLPDHPLLHTHLPQSQTPLSLPETIKKFIEMCKITNIVVQKIH